jgi:integrase
MLTMPLMQINKPLNGGICMKGSVVLRNNVRLPYWYVSWPHQSKVYKISRYMGESDLMYQTSTQKKHDQGYQKANKLRAMIQADWERHLRGELVFRIERYIGERTTDIIPYMEQWLEARRPTLTPGGYKKYRTAVYVHLIPFFKLNPIMLHEVRYDTLVKLLNWVSGSGKNKKNIVDTLRACLKFAWKSERIIAVPPFPERHLYDIRQKPPVWLPSDRYNAVIQKIPKEHRPFFMFLYLHLRRPGEAMALLKEDYDKEQDVFVIRRGVSNGKVIERTKTGEIHMIPCAADFKQFMKDMNSNPFSPYFFTCAESRVDGKRYTEKIYRKIWKDACEKAGENIDVYRGTKTSRASQLMNEVGLSASELKIAGDWARIESTEAYAKANVAKKRELLDRKVIPITKNLTNKKITH